VSALFMTGYEFPKRSVRSLYDRLRLPNKKCLLSLWQVTSSLKEVSALFMTGYEFPKRSICSLYDRLRVP
jgi:hypothetical protein